MEFAISEAVLEQILRHPMYVRGAVQWAPKSSGLWYECRLPVDHPDPDIRLELRATVNAAYRRKFSFSLLLAGRHCIRRLDVGGSHENKHTDTKKWHHATHKHRWTDLCHGSWAYTPEGFGSAVSIREAFDLFCAECGIRFTGHWTDPPPIQGRLLGM